MGLTFNDNSVEFLSKRENSGRKKEKLHDHISLCSFYGNKDRCVATLEQLVIKRKSVLALFS